MTPPRSPAPTATRKAQSPASHHEWILLGFVLLEFLLFHAFGRNFSSPENLGNIFRHSTEIGLLALMMLPVILAGGIDLSVGSIVGLCAVVFGKLIQDGGLGLSPAIVITLILGCLCGLLNGWLVTRMKLPPLIVTLGTYSLFRGIAEALTRGTATYSQFPKSFVDFGNQALLGLPHQAWLFAATALAVWIAIHRTTYGRALRAIGFSPEGSRHAGLAVDYRILTTYFFSGVTAAVAALILTSRLTQARADAGVGYELYAITAVVLGGASIFGGRGTVHGTLLGVMAVSILSNGLGRILPISGISRELAGMLTGVLLVVSLAATQLRAKWIERQPRPA